MIRLLVHVTLPDNTGLLCGEMVTTSPEPGGKIKGAFRYAPKYLKHPRAFSLDPVALPLTPKEFLTERPEGVHAVFEDALPEQAFCLRMGKPCKG